MVQDINAPYVPLTPQQRLKKIEEDKKLIEEERAAHAHAAYITQLNHMANPNAASRRNGRI